MATDKKQQITRLRKINATLVGNDAVDAELLIVKLGLNDSGKKKTDVDASLVSLSLLALSATIEETQKKTGNRHPTYEEVLEFINSKFSLEN